VELIIHFLAQCLLCQVEDFLVKEYMRTEDLKGLYSSSGSSHCPVTNKKGISVSYSMFSTIDMLLAKPGIHILSLMS